MTDEPAYRALIERWELCSGMRTVGIDGFFPAYRKLMRIKCCFVTPDSPLWAESLGATRHDFYHLPSYARLAARLEGGEAMAFVAEGGGRRLLVPLLVHPIPDSDGGGGERMFDATCSRGYPGPLLDLGPEQENEDFLDSAIGAFLEGLRERHIVACFSRLHPLLSLPLGPLQKVGYLIQHGESVSIDLTLSREEAPEADTS